VTDDLPFGRYEGGGRRLLGTPPQRDGTARHGYGPPVFAECGYVCVYCGLDMRTTFVGWLQLSVDHVIPRQMEDRGYEPEWVDDITNLVTCCRACNDFGNRFVVTDPSPKTHEAFLDLRDRVFLERRAAIAAKRAQEHATYETLPELGPDLPAPVGEAS